MYKKSFAYFCLLLILSFSSHSLFGQSITQPSSSFVKQEDLWYKNSIIYNLDLDAFKDSDGDGFGDFQGLMQKLDYLEFLGVDAIWLAPFQPSPMRDNGYDVKDYYGVDSLFGSGGDFTEFMFEAKKRGLRVITDLVINHTSKEHPWFQKARKDTSYRDWYVWSEERPEDWNKGMVFPGVQEETWTYDSIAEQYYYHRFYKFQPDLNMFNPEVQNEIRKVIGYWMSFGISGFRLDAVPFIVEDPYSDYDDPNYQFDLITDIRSFMQWRNGDAVILGEANVLPEETENYFGDEGNGLHLMFNFFANQHMFYALATADIKPFIASLKDTRNKPRVSQWAYFLRNHDELDLGRLTEKQRQQVYKSFGPEENMQVYNRGIRRRLAPMLENRKQLEMAYSLLFSLPGTPVIRYGDEIGMGDDLSLPERDPVRTPMQWTDKKNGGFSSADTTIRPVIDEGTFSYEKVNVRNQKQDPNSLLNWMADLIRLRKACPEIGFGEWEIMEGGSPEVLIMKYNWQEDSLLVMHNFSSKSQRINLGTGETGQTLLNLMKKEKIELKRDRNQHLNLEGYGYRWYRVENKSR